MSERRESREAERKKNLWSLWISISLSCRRQGQDLTLELGLVDIFKRPSHGKLKRNKTGRQKRFYLTPTVCKRVYRLFLYCSHIPTWVCQHELANLSWPCEGRFTNTEINTIGPFDWQYRRQRWRYWLLHFLCVNFCLDLKGNLGCYSKVDLELITIMPRLH